MRKIDFIIVGAMKAGTTTLVDYLKSHPDIAMPKSEIQFFSNDLKYEKGEKWYSERFSGLDERLVIGEKSAAYSYVESVPERIRLYNPNVKIIWVLRNPVRRTYSNYWHAVMQGVEMDSFNETVDKSINSECNDVFRDYIKRSKYIQQINHYLEYFDLSQMHFVIFEELISGPQTALNELSTFLKISPDKFMSLQKRDSNKGYRPYSIRLEYYSRRIFKNSIPGKVIHAINKTLGKPYPKMDAGLYKRLDDYFQEYNNLLFDLLEKENIWNKV